MSIFKIKVLYIPSLLPRIFIDILSMSPTIIPDPECSSVRNLGWGYSHYRFWMRKIIDDATIYFIALYVLVYETLCDWTSKQPFFNTMCDFYRLKTVNSHREVTRYAHYHTADGPQPSSEVSWGLVEHSSHRESTEHLVDRRLKQEQVNRFQPQSFASGVSRTQGFPPPGPFLHPGAFPIQYLTENFLLLIPCLVSLS